MAAKQVCDLNAELLSDQCHMGRFYGSIQLLMLFVGCITLCQQGCSPSPDSNHPPDVLFEKIPSSHSNIRFSNDLVSTQQHNIYTDSNFYAGGGVAIGDLNNDGLPDLYLVSNQGSNKLYLNRGNFKFEDITEQAGVEGGKPWATGISFADINGDGLTDIYVTYSAMPEAENRKNELFINLGTSDRNQTGQVPTFAEKAEEYGLADSGYSIHAVFLDYDNDGDLDMYLVNNYSVQPIGKYDLANINREEKNNEGGDRLYRNDDSIFIDVTEKAGIFSSKVSFGFGATVGDLNRDGWVDIYVSNDFFERDYLYINNTDGTFREVLEEKLSSISTTSMGGDIADLNGDGYPEIFITDMLPETKERLKKISDFIDWKQFQNEVGLGYHRKFKRNTLQQNHGDGTFSEIGRYAGVDATGWSWGALIADFNMDGMRDIFVPNGFYRDVTDNDHLLQVSRQDFNPPVLNSGKLDFKALSEMIPSVPVSNYAFENQKEFKFINKADEWGLAEPGFSHGAAYGDLDGNGTPDLVVNNVNGEAFVYRNRASVLLPNHSWLQVELKGELPNTSGIGAQVELVANGRYWFAEQILQRGFQSSVDPVLHFGMGKNISVIDTLLVRWPDGRKSVLTEVSTRQKLVVKQANASLTDSVMLSLQPDLKNQKKNSDLLLEDITEQTDFDWRHEESVFNDFAQFPLLFHMRSVDGPPVCASDVNRDGLMDFYAGGARGQPGVLFLQQNDGGFFQTEQPALVADQESEDTDCLFFDADGDRISELYVASGSSEFRFGSQILADRLYQIDEESNLTLLEDVLPRPQGGFYPTGVVRASDMDGDGYQDLFVGARMASAIPGMAFGYGNHVGGYLLKNDGQGRFEDVTGRLAPQLGAKELKTAGITDAAWKDLNGDHTPDLIVIGEWMPITIFYNKGGQLEKANLKETGLRETSGWWKSLNVADLNRDGWPDLVAGNHGLNSRFHASADQPIEMWAGDIDSNRRVEQIFAVGNEDGDSFPVALWHNLAQQLPQLRTRYISYGDYAKQTITDIFTPEELDKTNYFRVEELASVIAWNLGDGRFQLEQLPWQAQLAPVYSILSHDLNKDETPELLLGGNLDAVQPQAGAYDAGYGIVLRQDSTGRYTAVPSPKSGFFSRGNIRAIRALEQNDKVLTVVSRNNGELQIYVKK